jgi:uncharacterized membrane protein
VYLALLLVPFLGLWLLEPLLFLGALPDLAINLLSSLGDQTSISFHWTAGIVPFVVASSIFGAARFQRQAVRLSLWALAGAAAIAIYSPIYLARSDLGALDSSLVAARAHAVSLIPSRVPVSASNQLAGHLSGRRYIYTFPYVRKSRWIIVDIGDQTYGDSTTYRQVVRKYEMNNAWQVIFLSHGVAVLHKDPHAKRLSPGLTRG